IMIVVSSMVNGYSLTKNNFINMTIFFDNHFINNIIMMFIYKLYYRIRNIFWFRYNLLYICTHFFHNCYIIFYKFIIHTTFIIIIMLVDNLLYIYNLYYHNFYKIL